MSSFERLIRFEADNGSILYGNISDPSLVSNLTGAEIQVLDGDLDAGFSKTSRTAIVKKVLSPLPSVHYFICIGLNYQRHASEAKLQVPKYPVIFSKPPDALAGSEDVIHVHPDAQSQLDYEGELGVVIGCDAKDVSEENALNYVLGYVNSNDISARNFQIPADVSGGQFCYAKSFDGFAPIGPVLVSPSVIRNPQALNLTTKVNGELRQTTSTQDMIWTVRQLISFASKGTTLRKGTVILSGTPSGVGIFMKPNGFLKSGDVVEVGIEHLGTLRNHIHFDQR